MVTRWMLSLALVSVIGEADKRLDLQPGHPDVKSDIKAARWLLQRLMDRRILR